MIVLIWWLFVSLCLMGLEYLFTRKLFSNEHPPMTKKIWTNNKLGFLNQLVAAVCLDVQAGGFILCKFARPTDWDSGGPCMREPDSKEEGTPTVVVGSRHWPWTVPETICPSGWVSFNKPPPLCSYHSANKNVPFVGYNSDLWCSCLHFILIWLLVVIPLTKTAPPATTWLEHIFNILLIHYFLSNEFIKNLQPIFSRLNISVTFQSFDHFYSLLESSPIFHIILTQWSLSGVGDSTHKIEALGITGRDTFVMIMTQSIPLL